MGDCGSLRKVCPECLLRLTSAAAVSPPPRFAPLPHQERCHAERCDGVGPPPSKERIETDSGERDQGEPPAGGRLEGIRLESPAPQSGSRPPLAPREPDHDD